MQLICFLHRSWTHAYADKYICIRMICKFSEFRHVCCISWGVSFTSVRKISHWLYCCFVLSLLILPYPPPPPVMARSSSTKHLSRWNRSWVVCKPLTFKGYLNVEHTKLAQSLRPRDRDSVLRMQRRHRTCKGSLYRIHTPIRIQTTRGNQEIEDWAWRYNSLACRDQNWKPIEA